MKTLSQQAPWLVLSYPRWLCILRMMLGAFITFKGLFYMFNMGNFETMPFKGMDPLVDLMLLQAIVFLHFAGGVFIATGFYTRIAVLTQMPIVLAALAWVGSNSRLIVWSEPTELLISLSVLILLVLFLFMGSGRWSIDYHVKNKKLKRE